MSTSLYTRVSTDHNCSVEWALTELRAPKLGKDRDVHEQHCGNCCQDRIEELDWKHARYVNDCRGLSLDRQFAQSILGQGYNSYQADQNRDNHEQHHQKKPGRR